MKLLLLVAVLACVNAHWRIPVDLGSGPPSALIETENGEYDAEGHKFFQGDMILDQAQLDYQESPIDTRKAHSDLRYRWPNGRVPYRLTPASETDRDAILAGIRHWEENSCVRFNEVAADFVGPHIKFGRFVGCWSAIGHLYYVPEGQTLSIGPGCTSLGTVAHEIGHALGFYHEQGRPDRDDYVVILENNIEPNMSHNFASQRETNYYGIPYDLTSVMHYPYDGFSINGKNTMVTRDPLKHFVIGQRGGLSFYDKKLGNAMYNCSANCDSRIQCENEGYVDENCRCVCPSGFFGQNCQNGQATPDEPLACGGAINGPTTISSPNYPEVYPKNARCVWLVTAPEGRRVRAQFTAFKMLNRWEPAGRNRCIWDILELRTDNLHDGERYCDEELRERTMISQSNTMVLVFTSQSNYYKGFEAHIDFV